ncbi:MAG: tyrosine-type recombinase/integrase [Pseudomonadota bacterium]
MTIFEKFRAGGLVTAVARSKQSNRFSNRTQRFKHLAAEKQYWTPIDEGIALGYRRGKLKSMWYMRHYRGQGKYASRALALVDDYQDADGERVLSFYQAQDAAKRLVREAAEADRTLSARGGVTVAEAVERYLAHYEATSDKSTAEYRRVFERDVLPPLGGLALSKLTRARLVKWRDALISAKPRNRSRREYDPDLPPAELKRRRKATAQRKWTMLRAALNFAFTEGFTASDVAWRSIRPLADIAAPPPARVLTPAECRRVTAALPGDFRPLAQATFLTGAAYKELRDTRVDDYMPESGHLRVVNTKRRSRLVPLTEEGQRLFDALTAGRAGSELIFLTTAGEPWRKGQQARRMKQASLEVGIEPPVTLTSLRDAYGSLLLNSGVKLEVVSKAMGHASISTTSRHYAHLLQKTVDEQIRGGLPDLGIEVSKVTRL